MYFSVSLLYLNMTVYTKFRLCYLSFLTTSIYFILNSIFLSNAERRRRIFPRRLGVLDPRCPALHQPDAAGGHRDYKRQTLLQSERPAIIWRMGACLQGATHTQKQNRQGEPGRRQA